MEIGIFAADLAELIGVLAITMLFGISPQLKAVPVVGFKYAQREGKISLSLAVILVVFSILSNLFGRNLLNKQHFVDQSLSMVLFEAIPAAAACLMVLFLLWKRGQPLKSSGWHPLLWKLSLQFSIALVFLLVFLRGKIFTILNGVAPHVWLGLPLLLLMTLAEETVFRGYIQKRLSSFWNPKTGWLVTAFIFVLWQLPFFLPGLVQSTAGLVQLVFLILRSLLSGWMMHKSRHVLAPAVYRAVSAWLLLV